MTTSTSPRDWPEDFAHENGNYLCRCLSCGEGFLGYKRRMCCKTCATAMEAVEAERKVILAKAGLSSDDWVLMTRAEVQNMHGLYAGQQLKLNVEQKTRRELTKQVGDLLFQMECAATMDMGFATNHPMLKDVRAAHAKSEKLDEVAG